MPKIQFNFYESFKIVLGVSCIALSLGWGKFVGTTVYLPFYPDAIDVLLGVIIGMFLIYDYVKRIEILAKTRKIQTPSIST